MQNGLFSYLLQGVASHAVTESPIAISPSISQDSDMQLPRSRSYSYPMPLRTPRTVISVLSPQLLILAPEPISCSRAV